MSRKTTKPVAQVLTLPPLRVVLTEPRPCAETIEAAEKLLQEARAGRITGFLVVGLIQGGHHMAHAAGVATQQPNRLAAPFNELLIVLNTEAAMKRQEGPK